MKDDFFYSIKCFGEKVLHLPVNWKNVSDSAKKNLKTQIPLKEKENYLMKVWKPIDQVVLPSKKVYKYILDQNKAYWSHMELIQFWNIFCFVSGRPKPNIIPNSVTTCKNCLIDVWKSIDLAVILPRSVYNFFSDKKEGYWSHMELIQLWHGYPASTGWFFTLVSLHACTIQNSPHFTNFFVSTKNN